MENREIKNKARHKTMENMETYDKMSFDNFDKNGPKTAFTRPSVALSGCKKKALAVTPVPQA